AGALQPLAGRDLHPFRISAEVLSHQDDFESFCRAWSIPEQRLWLSALIGDWPAAQDAATGQPDVEWTTERYAKKCLHFRRERLLKETGQQDAEALYGLAQLNAADESLERLLQSAPSGL